ncbi:MAG: XTP/dITP diphosphatase [Dehalococcoidia bacterium]|nr:XTP/dITP diphosphatase [Dehalococcoidia bacterium]
MPKLLLATFNQGKIREYRLLLDSLAYRLTTLTEERIQEVVTESGDTYEQNARLKALAYARLTGLTTLADDSGLEVDALDGAPGVRSARFAGETAADSDRVDLLLARLNGVPWEKRTARFKCVIAIATPQGRAATCYGECQGIIAFQSLGEGGFGYDPVFFVPDKGMTMAELPMEIKNRISHRARASQQLSRLLQRLQM